MSREIVRSRIAPADFASLWQALEPVFAQAPFWGLAELETLGPDAQVWLGELNAAPGGRAVAATAELAARAALFGQVIEGTLAALTGPSAVQAFLDGIPAQRLVDRGLAEVVATVHDGDTLHLLVASDDRAQELERRLVGSLDTPSRALEPAAELDELDVVRLRDDVPEEGLRRGDVGAVVNVLEEPDRAYLVEFVDDDGSTRALCVLPAQRLERVPREG